MVTLEVGKSYITGFYNEEDPEDGAVVKIRGIVDEDTREYKRGLRFYSESGILYSPDGKTGDITHAYCDPNGSIVSEFSGDYANLQNIVREACSEDIRQVHEEFATVSLNECKDNPNFVPRGHSDFIMKLGGLYVDRMGIYRFISKINHFNDTEIWGEDGGRRFLTSEGNSYWEDGFEGDQDKPSMTDIACQKI